MIEKGTLVYRVLEHDPLEGQFTWRVESRIVAYYSARQLRLDKPFPGVGGLHFWPQTSVGRLFFLTEQEAVNAFVADQKSKIEAAERKIATANRALAWASAR